MKGSDIDFVHCVPLSFVRGAKDSGHRALQYENNRKDVIPILAEIMSWVVNQGPSNFSLGRSEICMKRGILSTYDWAGRLEVDCGCHRRMQREISSFLAT